MKRILFYTDTPLLGGAENHMLLLARFLPREKYEVTVACSHYKNLNGWCQKFLADNVKVVRLPVIHKHDPRHFLYMKKLEAEFDLVHLHLWNPASARFALLAHDGAKPLVVTEHDPFLLHGMKGWLKNKLIKKASRVIVVSRAAGETVIHQTPEIADRLAVIPNGIDYADFEAGAHAEERMALRKLHFGAADDEKIILCVAELHERKGQKFLIEAMREVAAKFEKVKLVLVGDGPQRKKYEQLAGTLGKKVLFLGQRKDVAPLMTAADLFVLPSIREAFGLVLLEAALCRVPIIASGVGGIPEIIEHGKESILVPPADAATLAKAISYALENPAIMAQLAGNAYVKVKENFSAHAMAAHTAAVYDELLNPSPTL